LSWPLVQLVLFLKVLESIARIWRYTKVCTLPGLPTSGKGKGKGCQSARASVRKWLCHLFDIEAESQEMFWVLLNIPSSWNRTLTVRNRLF
jgi:hypothetical protein